MMNIIIMGIVIAPIIAVSYFCGGAKLAVLRVDFALQNTREMQNTREGVY